MPQAPVDFDLAPACTCRKFRSVQKDGALGVVMDVVYRYWPWLAAARKDRLEGDAQIEVNKQLQVEDGKIYLRLKEDLLKRFEQSDLIGRLQIRKDLENVEEELARIRVGEKAIGYFLSRPLLQLPASDAMPPDPETVMHWLDQFDRLVRKRNEPWREELLARALVQENHRPGSVPARVLWLIGTIEQQTLAAFTSVLNLMFRFGNFHGISDRVLGPSKKYLIVPGAGSLHGDGNFLRLAYFLSDSGLLAEGNTRLVLNLKSWMRVGYASNTHYVETLDEKLEIEGTFLSMFGESFARLVDTTPNETGEKLYQKWLRHVDERRESVVHTIPPQNATAAAPFATLIEELS
jgi:hypothetical protein